jgi:transformer-2 protein
LHVRTSEGEIREVFDRFGPIDEIIMVKDSKTRGFRGYCFIYYNKVRDATEALNHCNGIELKERIIRVDYSLSAKPHSATPGVYQGKRRRSFARPRSPMGRSERTRYYDRPIRNDDRDRIRRHRSADRATTRRDDFNSNSRSEHRRRSREPQISPPRRERDYDSSRERGERHKKRA